MPGIRVVLADDHPMVRYGISAVLADADEVEVVAEAGDGEALLREVALHLPDVVVTDLDMPGRSGVDAMRELDAPVLVLTMHADATRVGEALRAGARGYVVKDAAADDILRAVEAVHADQAILDPAVTGVLLSSARATRRPAFPQLTERELDVLELLAVGAPNEAIAARLGISVKTVQNHVSNVLLKLGVATRAAAVARARDAGVGVGGG